MVALAFRSPVVPASAVAVGAMTPDLPLFVPWVPAHGVTHDLRWVPLTVVMAGAVWAVWRYAIAPAVPDLSPGWLAERTGSRPVIVVRIGPRVGRRIAGTVAALVIGVVSHLVWDAFTHPDRWGTTYLPLLRQRIGGQPVYSVLQELSSVLGLGAIGIWLLTRTRQPLDPARRQRVRRLRRIVIAGVVAAVLVAVVVGLTVTGPLWRQLMTTATTGGALVGLVLCAGVAGWWSTTAHRHEDERVRRSSGGHRRSSG